MHISEDSNLLTKEQLKMKGMRQANALLQQGTTLKQADMQPPGGARLGDALIKSLPRKSVSKLWTLAVGEGRGSTLFQRFWGCFFLLIPLELFLDEI